MTAIGTAILTYLKTSAVKHIVVIAVVIGALLGGRAWLRLHDDNLAKQSQLQAAQDKIVSLQSQQTVVAQQAKVQVVTLQAAAAKVTTAPEAIAAVPSVDPDPAAPLDAIPIADAPTKTEVNAVPLYQDLNVCKQTTVNLNACTSELSLQKQIDVQKDTQITALKAKPKFWPRLGKAAKVIGCSVAGGFAGSYIKGAEGAAIGAGAGAAICQMF